LAVLVLGGFLPPDANKNILQLLDGSVN